MHSTAHRLSLALMVVAGAVVVTFGVAAPPENCPAVTPAGVRAAAASTADWIITNQQPTGQWLYEYDRASDTESNAYNVVRHAGVMMSLYQAATNGVPGAVESADRGLEWARGHLVERDGWVAMTTTSTVQAGTNALLLAGLAERRLHTGDPIHDELMRGLARFLVSQTEPSGALLAYYDLGPDRPRDDTYSIYYTGEAYWALGRIHRLEPDAGWGATADLIGNYMATERDDAEDVWPPLADHWSGYGLGETAAFPERPAGEPFTDPELEFLRRQGGMIGQRVRSISQRFGPWGVVVRGTFTPRGGGYGVFGEGLAGLWRGAMLDERLADERAPLAARATCIVGLALDAQAGPDEAVEYADPSKVEGAWFIDDVTRMDDQQHAMSALFASLPILEAGADGSPGHPAPPEWLWLVVVIATLNPLRAALGVPRNNSRRERVASAAAGALLGSAGLLAFGALSGSILDLANASLPAMRLAAGALCLLGAIVDFVRPLPPTDDPTTGWAAAFVPTAVPIVARPVLVIAGLSVVADLGLGLYAAALVIAIALLVALVTGSGDDERPPSSLHRWVIRLTAAIAASGSVILIANAVFDI